MKHDTCAKTNICTFDLISTFVLPNLFLDLVDKDNSVVLGNRVDYIQKMKGLLSDTSELRNYC